MLIAWEEYIRMFNILPTFRRKYCSVLELVLFVRVESRGLPVSGLQWAVNTTSCSHWLLIVGGIVINVPRNQTTNNHQGIRSSHSKFLSWWSSEEAPGLSTELFGHLVIKVGPSANLHLHVYCSYVLRRSDQTRLGVGQIFGCLSLIENPTVISILSATHYLLIREQSPAVFVSRWSLTWKYLPASQNQIIYDLLSQ